MNEEEKAEIQLIVNNGLQSSLGTIKEDLKKEVKDTVNGMIKSAEGAAKKVAGAIGKGAADLANEAADKVAEIIEDPKKAIGIVMKAIGNLDKLPREQLITMTKGLIIALIVVCLALAGSIWYIFYLLDKQPVQ